MNLPWAIDWSRTALFVWLTGSAGWFLLAGWRVAVFQQLLRHARPAPAALQRLADALARDMGLPVSPPVLLAPGRLPPMLWSLGEPRLVLPAEFLEHIDPEQLKALLAHELAHLCRRDHWVRALEFVTLGLYWWLPVVWYARRALREAEEQCCDAWVVSTLPGSGKTYAHALLETLDFLSSGPSAAPMLASGIGQVSDLKRRLRMIMTGKTPRALSWRGFIAVLGLGLLLLPLLPAWVLGVQAPPGEEAEQPRRPERGREREREKGPPPKPEEVEKAQAEIKHLRDELNKRATEIAEIGKKLHEAHRKVGGGPEGRRGPEGGEPRAFMLRRVDDHWELMPMPFGGPGGRFGPGGRGPDGRGPEGRGPGFERPPGPPPEGGFRPGGPGREGPQGGDRVEQLERRLEAVMRALQEIRHELHGQRGPGGPRPERRPPPPGGEGERERKPLDNPPPRRER